MIRAAYTPGSRIGNQMTQYASLYGLSRYLNCQLIIPPIDSFPNTVRRQPAIHPRGVRRPLKSRHFINREEIKLGSHDILTNHECGYLENIYNFHEFRAELAHLFSLPDYPLDNYTFFTGPVNRRRVTTVGPISSQDLVISLRLGDFLFVPDATERWKRCVYTRFLGFEYFELVLRNTEFNRLFITSDEPFHPTVDEFLAYQPIIVQNDSPSSTMSFIRKFGRVAISESTFSWWAAYLTDAADIYFPISNTGLWGVNTQWNSEEARWQPINALNERDNDLYLRVDDDRYKYVHQQSGVIYRYRDAPGKRSREEFLRFARMGDTQ